MTKKSEAIPGFDCVKFKGESQEQIRRETEGMTREQEVAYFRESVKRGPFADLWQRLEEARLKRERSGASVVREEPEG